MKLYDAHNHLQDPVLGGELDRILTACEREGIAAMIVNGTCEDDWEAVAALTVRHPIVRPSFGVHPWNVDEISTDWRERFVERIDAGGCVGEIGLDRWKTSENFELQLEVFRFQLAHAAERNLPVTIHCLRAWGALAEELRKGRLPDRGFLLHAYGGSVEMAAEFAEMGAYFSFSGSFVAPGRERKLEPFRKIPLDRLLVETDAPAMPIPREFERYSLPGQDEHFAHPANLGVAYEGLAHLRGMAPETLADAVEENFLRFFG